MFKACTNTILDDNLAGIGMGLMKHSSKRWTSGKLREHDRNLIFLSIISDFGYIPSESFWDC